MKITKLHAALLISTMGLMGMYGEVFLAKTAGASQSGLQGNIYYVEGDNAGNKFDACFKFKQNNTLEIEIKGIPALFTYVHDSRSSTWQAVRQQQPGIGLNGKAYSNLLQNTEIRGQGINVMGGTFTFKGKISDATCRTSGTKPDGGMMEERP